MEEFFSELMQLPILRHLINPSFFHTISNHVKNVRAFSIMRRVKKWSDVTFMGSRQGHSRSVPFLVTQPV